MSHKRLPFVIILILSLACNFVTSTLPRRLAASTAVVPVTGGSSTLQPAYVPPDCVGTPIATLPPPAEQAVPTPSIQANQQVDHNEQLQIFDETTKVISDAYVYPDFNGNNWNAIVAAHRAKV